MLRGCILVIAGCGRIYFDPLGVRDANNGDGGTGADAQQICGPWSPPTEVSTLTSPIADWEPALHPGGDLLVYSRFDKLYSATRSGSTFTNPAQIAVLTTSPQYDFGPAWSPAGDQLFFVSDRISGNVHRLWVSDFDGSTFQTPVQVSELANTTVIAPALSGDGLELYFSTILGGSTIARAERATLSSPWVVTGVENQLRTPGGLVGWPALSPDSLTLYFEGLDAAMNPRIYQATRTSTAERFGTPSLVAELVPQTAGDELGDPDISRDGTTLLLAIKRAASTTDFDIYASTRTCQ